MSEAVKTEGRAIPYVLAITEGVRQILEEQDNAFVAGEDVGEAGSVYGYYRGLIDQFGEHRIIDTPISEKGIIGLGLVRLRLDAAYSGHYVHGLFGRVYGRSR